MSQQSPLTSSIFKALGIQEHENIAQKNVHVSTENEKQTREPVYVNVEKKDPIIRSTSGSYDIGTPTTPDSKSETSLLIQDASIITSSPEPSEEMPGEPDTDSEDSVTSSEGDDRGSFNNVLRDFFIHSFLIRCYS